jgi:hypothetical protein
MENALGSEHPDIAPILDDMSLFYRKMGRTLDAKRVNERAMAIRARKR